MHASRSDARLRCSHFPVSPIVMSLVDRRSYVVKRLLFAGFDGVPQRRARDRSHDIHIV